MSIASDQRSVKAQSGCSMETGNIMTSQLTTEPVLEFRSVSVSFDDTPALTDVSFQLGHGEMIFVTGESASGKSVLLHLAMGLIRPDAGHILIQGREIDTLDESDLLAIRGGLMGMVFQEDSLFTGLSVFDNVAYRLKEHEWPEAEIEAAVPEVLNFVGLDGEEEKLPEELSGGMKRRLEIARALIGWPSIMLYDEPTMGLDPIATEQVLNLILRTRDINQTSTIYVTKRPHELGYLANFVAVKANGAVVVRQAEPNEMPRTRVILLQAGKIAFTGSLTEFETSDLATAKEMLALDAHDHSADPYFPDPWDKKRRAAKKLQKQVGRWH